MDEDEIIQQAMNEDNKIATDQFQQSDDMMDMDLIKRAETNYMPMPMSGGYLCLKTDSFLFKKDKINHTFLNLS